MKTLQINDPAPDFRLKGPEGQEHRLEDFRGKFLVLYFYPKDDTPGCTKEACSFRDDYRDYTENGIAIVGISADSPESHRRFAKKHDLPFILLSDPEKETLEAYGAWGEKSMYGKRYMGVIRKTFLIDKNGRILKIYPKVRVEGHSEDILKSFGIK
ncbi:MAG: thioredoxin-dependent thiol peroxidase [Candidatus Neomarinimicrobiota bacterium]|nr:thioredoxin-dependent thiol peroxidase [Candidatus Neomarinimicrobiota bacterium]MDX9779832.1 thioredoxin-dependent thiol peroxidase [bacterium]